MLSHNFSLATTARLCSAILVVGTSTNFAFAAETILFPDPASVVLQVQKTNPELQSAAWEIEKASGRLDQSGRRANPEISLSLKGDQAFANEGKQAWSVAVSQQLPLSRRLDYERRLSTAELKTVRLEWLELSHQTALNAVQIWHEALSANSLIELLERQLVAYREWIDTLEDAVRQGELSGVQLNQLRLTYRAEILHKARLQRSLAESVNQLRLVLGFPENQEIQLPTFNPEKLAEFSQASSGPYPVAKSPSLMVAEARQQTTQQRTKLVQAEKWQDIKLELEYETERRNDFPAGLQRERFLALSVSIPLPLWNRNQGNIRQALASQRQASSETRSLQRRQQLETTRLNKQLREQIHYANAIETELLSELQEQNEALQGAWLNGEVSFMELLRGYQQQMDVQRQQLDAQLEAYRTYIQLQALTLQGPFQVTIPNNPSENEYE